MKIPKEKKIPRIELLTLGDELLLGIRVNAHLAFIGEVLERNGIKLQRNMVVQDDLGEIKTAFKNAWARADVVIMTGGLGAARVTNAREAVAGVLGIGLEFVPEVEKAIKEDFESIGRKMGKRFLRQCYKLDGSRLLPNHFGTAPGIWYEEKDKGKILVMLPGMASEMKPLFEKEVLPRFQDKGYLMSSHAYFQLRTIGIDEEALEERMEPMVEKYPGIMINYVLFQGIIDVRLSSGATLYSWSELKRMGEECRNFLGDDFFAFGHGHLANIVLKEMRTMECTVAVAESCTGGRLSDAFTNIPGASKVFSGGVVCYSNEAKMSALNVPEALLEQHGAVSAEVAVAMAIGASELYSTDYGLSVTGFAGPSGGTSENPVGSVFIGYSSPQGVWAHKVMYPGQREAVKVRAVNVALDWMRRKLKQEKLEDYMADINKKDKDK